LGVTHFTSATPDAEIDSPFKPSTERLCIVAYHPADAIIRNTILIGQKAPKGRNTLASGGSPMTMMKIAQMSTLLALKGRNTDISGTEGSP